MLGSALRWTAAGVRLALTAPFDVAGRTAKGATTLVHAAEEAAELGGRATAQGAREAVSTGVRLARVAANAGTVTGGRYWHAGSRLHLPLRPQAGRGARGAEAAARRVAAQLANRPDVLAAYWDGGLARLVVQLAEDAVTDRVVSRAGELAARERLERPDEDVLERGHPAQTGGVRSGIIALACDAAGLAAATAAQVTGQRSTPRLMSAAAGLLREDPRVRRALRARLGRPTAELVLAATNAAAEGFGRSPASLALDAALRATQLAEAVARAATFDRVHDTLCGPERDSVAGDSFARPPLRPLDVDAYEENAVAGTALGAASTLLFTRDLPEAAEALRAGNPKAARYGPEAFTAALAAALAHQDVLVRNHERLRQLSQVDTIVLSAGALRGSRRTVVEVGSSSDDWDEARLWRAARAAVSGADARDGLTLRPVPDSGPDARTGLMVASAYGRDVGTVLVGREPDPLAEPLLKAARLAGLDVVLADDGSLGDLAALADRQVATPDAADLVAQLQRDGHTVLTVAQVGSGNQRSRAEADDGSGMEPGTGVNATDDTELALLLRGNLALALTGGHSTVVWGADVLLLGGLAGAWRLVAAVPAARAATGHAKILAEAGAALSGLLVITRGQRSQRLRFPVQVRLSPVAAATTAALLSGWYRALTVALRRPPQPYARVAWHALGPDEAMGRLRKEREEYVETDLDAVVNGGRRVARQVAATPVAAPLRVTSRLVGAAQRELADPLTPVLVVGAVATALLGSVLDALLVGGAMTVNAGMGAVQRVRVEHALSSLTLDQRRTAHRITNTNTNTDTNADTNTETEASDGTARDVDARRLRVGDVIALGTGDVLPADARLLEAEGLEVDESSLTGESLPTRKDVDPVPGAAVPERSCMVHEGTTVVAGHGTAVVVATGERTEGGRAAQLAAHAPAAAGAQARLNELTRRALPYTLLGGAAVAALSLLRGRPVRQAVQGGLAVAVAAVPEGLPLVATVAQLAAARRLSKHGVLVRSSRTLEALGRMDTVCFDKTGTLTENRLRVARTTGPDGTAHDTQSDQAAALLRAAARTCPEPAAPGEALAGQTHRTDTAILDAAPPDPDWSPGRLLAFEAARGYAAAVGTEPARGELLVIKGAPEVVLPLCENAAALAPEAVERLAAEGLRVLAVAERTDPPPEAPDADQPPDSLRLLGFVGLADTPRGGSARLVRALRETGVHSVVLTGDHPGTARAVAQKLGWEGELTVVTGDELAPLDRAGRAQLLGDCDVVARVAPEQKVQVIEALRQAGRVVAMVGDGANDAAAIRAADIGIGVATHGSAAARHAADLVLLDDELTPLTEAVAEGRALWQSVTDAVAILIGGNAGEIGFALLGTLLGGASPLTTRQILLVNLFTDMFPAMAVAVTPRSTPPPRPAGAPSPGTDVREPDGPLMRHIADRGVATALGGTAAWLAGTWTPGSARRTATMALCGVVGAQLVQTVQGRHGSPLVLATAIGSALALVAIVETPGVSQFFGCTPLGPVALTGVLGAVALAAACAAIRRRPLDDDSPRLREAPEA
jgi:cation-transporting ATPase I